jgi:hypothetical protein
VAITIASIEETRALGAVLLGVVESAWFSVSRDTIAL